MQYKYIQPQRLLNIYDEIFAADSVLTKEACDLLINSFSGQCKSATVAGVNGGQRNNLNTIAISSHPVVSEIKKYCSQITKTNIAFQEEAQFIKYEPSMYYQEHYDFFENPNAILPSQFGRQRWYSILFYLNSGKEGGETRFPKFKISFKPEAGKMLMWKNLKNNQPNYDMLHESKPTDGWTKYALILWIRM